MHFTKNILHLSFGIIAILVLGYYMFQIPGKRPVLAQASCVSAADILNNYQQSCMFIFKTYNANGYSVYAPVSQVSSWIHASMHACQSPVSGSSTSVRTLDATSYIYDYGYSGIHGFSGSNDSTSSNTKFNNSYVGPLCDNVTVTPVDTAASPFQPDFDYVILADPAGTPQIGDVTGDGNVDFVDYSTENQAYNTTSNCPLDLVTSSGCLIDLFDLSKIISNLGL